MRQVRRGLSGNSNIHFKGKGQYGLSKGLLGMRVLPKGMFARSD